LTLNPQEKDRGKKIKKIRKFISSGRGVSAQKGEEKRRKVSD